jgi:tetratricopeptide (TPR) repeat protein
VSAAPDPPAPSEPPPPPEPAEEQERERHIGKWAPITLAAIVVLGAGLAILQTNASTNESNTARETTRTAVEALRAGVVDRAADGLQDRVAAERESLPYRDPLSEAPADEVQQAQGEIPDLTGSTRLEALSVEARRLSLKQAALTETRVTWNDRSTQYTTVIAVLAVALFFVGFSMVVRGRVSPIFYVTGLVVAGFVVLWATWIHELAIPHTPDEAVTQTAKGLTERTQGQLTRAIASFDRAIALEPDYAPAYSGRSAAEAQRANPDIFTTGAVTAAAGGSSGALEDAARADDLSDGSDPVALGLLALGAFHTGDYAGAIEAADRILEVNDRAVEALLLKSAAQVGAGDTAGAEASARDARELLQGVTASAGLRRLVRDYLTYLEAIAAANPDRAAEAERLAARTIAVETGLALGQEVSGELPAGGSAKVTGLRLANGRIEGRLELRDLPPNTSVATLGYERPTEDGPWVQPADDALFESVQGNLNRDFSVPVAGTCAPTAVQTRVYLNGVLADTATAPGTAPTC